jgi:hypothetical protein
MKSTVINATKARSEFFELLNRVLYGNERVLISKAGSKDMVELRRVEPKTIDDLAGVFTKEDANIIEETIKADRKKWSSRDINFE